MTAAMGIRFCSTHMLFLMNTWMDMRPCTARMLFWIMIVMFGRTLAKHNFLNLSSCFMPLRRFAFRLAACWLPPDLLVEPRVHQQHWQRLSLDSHVGLVARRSKGQMHGLRHHPVLLLLQPLPLLLLEIVLLVVVVATGRDLLRLKVAQQVGL